MTFKSGNPVNSEEILVLRNMADVEAVIASRRASFTKHGFLRALEEGGTLDMFKSIAPTMAFFVLCFQDVLRLAYSKSSDPLIRQICEVHALEDSGHDRWYLLDLEQLQVPLDVASLFSAEHQTTRDVAFGQVSSVIAARYDQTRLAVALSLEAIGAECFGRVISLLERVGSADGLQYFARRHQQIEQNHVVFEASAKSTMGAIPVPSEARDEVLQAVNDTFEGMLSLMSHLEGIFGSAS
jgi:hypothetical protein